MNEDTITCAKIAIERQLESFHNELRSTDPKQNLKNYKALADDASRVISALLDLEEEKVKKKTNLTNYIGLDIKNNFHFIFYYEKTRIFDADDVLQDFESIYDHDMKQSTILNHISAALRYYAKKGLITKAGRGKYCRAKDTRVLVHLTPLERVGKNVVYKELIHEIAQVLYKTRSWLTVSEIADRLDSEKRYFNPKKIKLSKNSLTTCVNLACKAAAEHDYFIVKHDTSNGRAKSYAVESLRCTLWGETDE